jgi:hypothetical protein
MGGTDARVGFKYLRILPLFYPSVLNYSHPLGHRSQRVRPWIHVKARFSKTPRFKVSKAACLPQNRLHSVA